MSRPALYITSTPDEWLRAVSGPYGLVVELSGIPERLICDLRHTDGVGTWTFACYLEAARSSGVVHVILVVRAVEVFAVPASELC